LTKFEERGANLVAISVDPPERSKALAERLGVTFPVLSDVDLKVVRAYGVEDGENGIAWPAIFVVGTDGAIRWRSLAETYPERPASEVVLKALTRVSSRPPH
jgi:peroxiredoxin